MHMIQAVDFLKAVSANRQGSYLTMDVEKLEISKSIG